MSNCQSVAKSVKCKTGSSQVRNRSRKGSKWLGLLCVLALAVAGGPALALDSLDIPMSMDATADAGSPDAGCPALTRIKYPWASCTTAADGSIRMTGAPNSRAGATGCRLHLTDGRCAASPDAWYPINVDALQPPVR